MILGYVFFENNSDCFQKKLFLRSFWLKPKGKFSTNVNKYDQ